jgi:S1-C subfamily serine protease
MLRKTKIFIAVTSIASLLGLTGCGLDLLTRAAIEVGGHAVLAGIDAATSNSGTSEDVEAYCWDPEKQSASTSTSPNCWSPQVKITEDEYEKFKETGVPPTLSASLVAAAKTSNHFCVNPQGTYFYTLSSNSYCAAGDSDIPEDEWRRRQAEASEKQSTPSQSIEVAYCWDPDRQIAYRRPDATSCIGTDRKVTEAQFPELEAREEAHRAAAAQKPAPAASATPQKPETVSPAPANPTPAEKPVEPGPNVAALEKPQQLDLDGLAYRGNGSGFFISAEGHVLTNHHVVDGCPVLGAMTADGIYGATVVAADADIDLAIIQADNKRSKQAAFANRLPEAGDDVYAIGFPLFDEFFDIKITDGIVSGLSGFDGDRRFIQMTAPIQPGNSGGPLVDAAGLVVGVIESKRKGEVAEGVVAEGVGFAVAPEVASKFIRANGLTPKVIASEKERKVRDIMRDAKQWTVLIACFSVKA